MQRGLPINPAHPEEPLVFVSISSGEEDQKQESRAGDAELGVEHKGVSAATSEDLEAEVKVARRGWEAL